MMTGKRAVQGLIPLLVILSMLLWPVASRAIDLKPAQPGPTVAPVTKTGGVPAAAQLPDLAFHVGYYVWDPEPPAAGDPAGQSRFRFSVRNIGQAPAGPSRARVTCQGATPCPPGMSGMVNVPALAPGSLAEVTWPAAAPRKGAGAWTAGTYTLVLELDAAKQITEADETNNLNTGNPHTFTVGKAGVAKMTSGVPLKPSAPGPMTLAPSPPTGPMGPTAPGVSRKGTEPVTTKSSDSSVIVLGGQSMTKSGDAEKESGSAGKRREGVLVRNMTAEPALLKGDLGKDRPVGRMYLYSDRLYVEVSSTSFEPQNLAGEWYIDAGADDIVSRLNLPFVFRTDRDTVAGVAWYVSSLPLDAMEPGKSPAGMVLTDTVMSTSKNIRFPIDFSRIEAVRQLVTSRRNVAFPAHAPDGGPDPFNAVRGLDLSDEKPPMKMEEEGLLLRAQKTGSPAGKATKKSAVLSFGPERQVYYVRAIPLDSRGLPEDRAAPSNSVKVLIQFPPPRKGVELLPGPRLRITRFEPARFPFVGKGGFVVFVHDFRPPAWPYAPDSLEEKLWLEYYMEKCQIPHPPKAGTRCYFPPPDKPGFMDQFLEQLEGFVGVFGDLINWAAETWEDIKDEVIDAAVSAGGLVGLDCDPVCQAWLKRGLEAGMAAMGVPPTLPDVEAMVNDGKEYLVQQIADQAPPGYEGIAEDAARAVVDELEKEIRDRRTASQSPGGHDPAVLGWTPDPYYYERTQGYLVVEVSNPHPLANTVPTDMYLETDSGVSNRPAFYKSQRIRIPSLGPGSRLDVMLSLDDLNRRYYGSETVTFTLTLDCVNRGICTDPGSRGAVLRDQQVGTRMQAP